MGTLLLADTGHDRPLCQAKVKVLQLGKLEAVSQMPQQNEAAGKVKHAEKVISIAFVAGSHTPRVLQPAALSSIADGIFVSDAYPAPSVFGCHRAERSIRIP